MNKPKMPKIKFPKIKVPTKVRHWYENMATRPVKHIALHKLLHATGPVLFVWIVSCAVIAPQVLNAINKDAPWWRIVGLLVFYVAYIVFQYRTTFWWHRMKLNDYDCFHSDPMGMDDLGEDATIGEGWRRVRFTFAVTYGHGRVSRAHMEWIELGVNPFANVPMVPLRASDPRAQQAFEEYAADNPIRSD